MPSVNCTIIIPSFKRPVDLRRCLEAIAIQSKAPLEVLVICREEDTQTSEVVFALQDRIPMLQLVRLSEPGLIAAMNRGLEVAQAELLVFTDDDSGPQEDWLERIGTSFADPTVGAVGGRDWIQLPDEPALFEPAPVSKVGVLTWYGTQYGNHHCPLRGHRKRVMYLKGVNMAFRRKVLGSYRIDTNLRGPATQSGADMDLCARARKAGFDVVF